MQRFGEFEFQPATGELRRTDGAQAEWVRLAPQPARLLALLLDRAASGAELLSREEIRQELWPDTHVDFDQSLTFCIGQVRAALGDSGSSPRYVETLPRRGYRLLVEVSEATAKPSHGTARPGRPLALAALLVALVAVAVWRLLAVPSPPSLRISIQPFELAAAEAVDRGRLARISEWLVVELGNLEGVAVVGPRTTAAYDGDPFPDLRALARDHRIDLALNCRYLNDASGEPMLVVELIRLSDGDHPWVERFAPAQDWQSIAAEVRDGVISVLAAGR